MDCKLYAPTTPELNVEALPGIIDLWLIDLTSVTPSTTGLLNKDERTRASRFSFLSDARHFEAARGYLRLVRYAKILVPCSPLRLFQLWLMGQTLPAVGDREAPRIQSKLIPMARHLFRLTWPKTLLSTSKQFSRSRMAM
jgi:hypothetical protein